MNHRPFEDWLLDNQPLTPAQKQELKNHLKTCASCTALTEVDLALKSTSRVAPRAGFTERFQLRLVAERKKHHTRQLWGFGLLGLIILLSAGVVIFEFYTTWEDSPVQILLAGMSWLVTMFSSVRTYGSIGFILLKVIARIIPLSLWLVAAGGGFMVIFVWATSLWKLSYASNARRLA
jgi:hypothetical protein